MCHTCQMFKPCKSLSRLKLCKMRSDISPRGWKTILSVVRNIQAKLMISQVSPSTIANSQLEKFFTSCPEKLKSEMDGNKFRNKNILRILFWENHLFGKSADFVFSRIFQLSFEASWHPVFSLLLCNPLKEKKIDDESFFLQSGIQPTDERKKSDLGLTSLQCEKPLVPKLWAPSVVSEGRQLRRGVTTWGFQKWLSWWQKRLWFPE